MQVSISLVALALGYKVFVDAHKEKEGLKLLGQIIGIFVMLAALMSVFCGVGKCMKSSECSMSKSKCPMMIKAACPMSSAPADSSK